ncbi:hypothetical protein ACFV4P_14975 [Kitasatospora sp. NPDC059795]|uniref:hypothetical protein n=1 Tax=unclassified Kitasatospora TaxID=2633591 RepID=UPI00093CE0EA|nr:hypothetical protein [Kitasatospora sp. CB01950]
MNGTMRKSAKGAVAIAAAAVAVLGATGTASANTTQGLLGGQSLNIGDSVVSNNSGSTWFELTLQSDGNLVEYRWDGGSRRACWATNTSGSAAHHATYQTDGNFVLYTQSGSALWSSSSSGTAVITVSINSSGYLYVGQKKITNGC